MIIDHESVRHNQRTLIYYAVGGIVLIVLVCMFSGCGSVVAMEADAGAAGSGAAGSAAPDAGHDVLAMLEHAPAETAPPACVPDVCNTCVDNTLTPVADGLVGGCTACRGGKATPLADGFECGATTCSGDKQPTGFPSGDVYKTSSDARVCLSGICTTVTTACSTIDCPSTCVLKYRGCVTDKCWCVDSGGSVCGGTT